MQCSDGQCWCTTKCGMEIPNTRMQGSVTCSEALLATYSAPCTGVTAIPGYTPACDENGFFQPKQCNVNECWCITVCGQEVSETRTPIGQPLDCSAVMQNRVSTSEPIVASTSCADGSAPLNCDQQNICNRLTCNGYPSAICRPNTCKGCIIEWFNSENSKLTCTDNKAGRCPAYNLIAPVDQSDCSFRCNSDADCNGAHKCCSTGCGTKCVVAKMEKWGSCPASKSFLDNTCSYRCTSDFDCLGDEKCCSNGCGKVCTQTFRTAKVGTCPAPKTFGMMQSNCAVQCRSDEQCSSTQKCCNTECGTTCSEPVTMKTPTLLRVCPATIQDVSTCSRTCQTTSDCSNDEACCTTLSCGRQCIKAITYTSAPKPCETEKTNKPTKTLGGTTVSLQGVHTPNCGPGGYHTPKQCDSTSGLCWCVSACGTPIQGTHTSGPLTCRYDEPPCRKEYQHLSSIGFGARQIYCRQDGFYESRQCHGSICWCVDRCGNEIKGTKGSRSTVTCECPGNEHAWLCNPSPCDSITCDTYPSATCRVNFCSGCKAEFYVNDVKVECDTPKNGMCPIADHVRLPQECTNECTTDSSCQGTKKCCEYGCSTICVSAEPQLKNGQCPAIPADYYGSCTSECAADRDCNGKAKCCFNGCGRICMLPQQETFVGQCPFPWADVSTCNGYSSSCVHNGDCPTNQMCCESGCGKQCRASEGVTSGTTTDTNKAVVTTNAFLNKKTGMCPAAKYLPCSYVQECAVDSDCTGESKCCNNGCGFVCTGPWTSTKYGVCPRASVQDVLTNAASCTTDMNCPGNRKCCNIDATQKACVNVWEKVTSGQCPSYTSLEVTSCVYTDECATDVDCLIYGTGRKCCSTPCGGTKCKVADVYPSCMYKGKQYVHQDFWSPDSCTVCKCWSGTARCTQRKCPRYDATKCQSVYRDGQCCPDVYCESQNVVGQPAVKCTDQQGLSYQNGDVWYPDICSECRCIDGQVSCSNYKCFTESPQNTTGCTVINVPGKCCPEIKCQDTCVDHAGNLRYENDQWMIEDCVTCRCFNGKVSCVSEVCPMHHDPSCELRKVKGQCCSDVFCPVTINPSRMCVDGANSYGDGTEFTRGACEKCLCMNRVIECQTIECAADTNPLLANCLKVNIEGRCCPEVVCNQEAGLCTHEGSQYFDSETWQPDTCTLCTCEKGVTKCHVMSCPPIKQGCTAQFVDGKCCPQITCQSSAVTALCFNEGTWRSEGDTWNQGRCDVCTCTGGVVTCNPMTCPRVQASAGCHVVQHNGFCCPVKVCRGSDMQCVTPELTIANGENYTISNPLPAESGHVWYSPMTVTERAHCTCNMGRLTCTRSACPVAQYPCTEQPLAVGAQGCASITCPFVKPGVCPFPRPGFLGSCDNQCNLDSDCQGATKCCSNGCGTECSTPWREGCVDETGSDRTSGDVWYQDLCTICKCVNNQSICEEQQCPEVPTGCSIKLVNGKCCGEIVCQPSSNAQVVTCSYEGQTYMPGNTWIVDSCTSCRCTPQGRTICDKQICPETSNFGCRMLYVAGKCCPEKVCREPKSCLYDGVYYLNSEKFYVSACEECQCLNGIVTCQNQTCPTPTGMCTYETPVGVDADFSCCKNITCPLIAPGQTCTYNGMTYNYNELFMRDACTSCRCNAGEVTCTTTSCPQVNLEPGCRAVPVFGKCCPQITCRDVHSCIESGVEHLNGEQWTKDKCTTCRCDHGMMLCTKRTCPMPRPGCQYDLTAPNLNQCCGDIKCPRSPGYRKCTDKATNVRYNHGEVWMRDSCTQCQCRHGYTKCNVFTCPTNVADGCRTLNIEGQCCPHVLCDTVKVGQCPAYNPLMDAVTVDMCGSDADCVGKSKCCNTPAARTCMSPVILERPGSCPNTQPTSGVLRKTCVTECTADSECTQNWKCCSDGGCSRVCRPPVMNDFGPNSPLQPIVPQEPSPPGFDTKDGVCPKTVASIDRLFCLTQCSIDTDCTGSKKCCSAGCGRSCVIPLPTNNVKTGVCPMIQPQGICQSNIDVCSLDNECTANKKCCFNGCFMECLAPGAPVIKCPVVSLTCNKLCPEGYATDPEGCEICECARTCQPINAQTCNKECVFGYATDGRGCQICSCKHPSFPEQPAVRGPNSKPVFCEVLKSSTCPLTCTYGFKTDLIGCETCSCKQAPNACTPLTSCGLYCPYGLATNANGCEICQCKIPDMNKIFYNPIKTFCERPNCVTNRCSEGYATDSHGCDMRNCMCKRPATDCPRMTPETCTERCPYGYATDTRGCEVCKCRLSGKCPDMSSCVETCVETGFQTDKFGCKQCSCNPRPISQCPPLTIQACPMKEMCAYGLATDDLGCPMCVCKLPGISCQPLSCNLRCVYGLRTDNNGCELCECKQPSSKCPIVSNLNCKKVCPFGLATCSNGCEICSCKLPVSKTSNKFHSKTMYGATCEPLTSRNCALTCPDGYATDFGCEICQCRQPEVNCPVLTDVVCPRKLTCPYGLSSNSQGCPICECKQPISCSVNECAIECPYGYATDLQGCDICKCKLAPSATCKPMTIHTCQKMCTFGYATDVNGCEICACKQPSVNMGITVSESPMCQPLTGCQASCNNGYATDNNGCEICSCRAPGSRCTTLSFETCPQVTTCPYGLATNSDGCDICSCKIPATCPKVDRTNCDKLCDFGYATNSRGCEICLCKVFNPRSCSLVHDFNCRKFCPYGLATNALGCEICECKLPPGQETYSVVTLTPVTRCPKNALRDCTLTCPNGYATNNKGCKICRCKESEPVCTVISQDVCPKIYTCEFGLETNEIGCEICSCRQPALCKSMKTCNTQCEYGFATDRYGCEICECKRKDSTCTSFTNCNVAQNCRNGLATDPITRCEICKCKMPRAPEFFGTPDAGKKNFLIPQVKTCNYSPQRSCALTCTDGYATDYKGCEICKCKIIDNNVCPVIIETVCPLMRRCEYGLATNANGCNVCECKVPALCQPIDSSNCNLRCEYGFATDSYGCQKCSCKNQATSCVPVTSVNCPLTCTLGLATDSEGCEICKCRMPCVIKTFSFKVPTTAQPDALVPQSRWIPNLQCFNLNDCLRTCPYGYVTNTMGCEICQCRKSPSQCQTVTSDTCPIKETCPYGLRTDVDGCEICSCKQPTPCSTTPSAKCTTVCLNGYATDTAGCPDYTLCKCKRSAASRVCNSRREEMRNCKKSCAYGYASNTFGCPICKCQQPTSKELSNRVSVSRTFYTTPNKYPTTFYSGVNSVNTVNCPLINSESCTLTCNYGFATDTTGCTICRCRSNPASCTEVSPDVCPLALTAKYGLATNNAGCDMCIARRPITCNPINTHNCANTCLYGYATDSFGCEVCNICAKPPGECLVVLTSCQKSCNYGYATDPQGCSMCLCRQPPSFKTSRVINFKPAITPSTAPTPTCPELNCALSCSQGYATDPNTGCALCKCSALNCRERECAGKCPFGVVTNRKGCPTCTCKKPITCAPLGQCDLVCPRGYATNIHGCEICMCKKNFDVCPEPMCEIDETLRCSFGYATDANGCEICQCKMPVRSILPIKFTPAKCTPLSSETCSERCPDGYATDTMGCEICTCIKPVTECGIIAADCAIAKTCPYGLATDDLGCTICKCKMPCLCTPLPRGCNENCEYGFATNFFGCEVCRCKEYSSSECPSLDGCNLNCPLGLASNREGCEICKCKYPTTEMVSRVRDMTPVQGPNMMPTIPGVNVLAPEPACPTVNCFVHCPHGFAIDPVTGCENCDCKAAPLFTCPAVPRTTHSMCVNFCSMDSDCPSGAYCCSNGCGKTCLTATSNECIDEHGVSHASGKLWMRDSCTRCSCDQGTTSCTAFKCDPIPQGCQPYYITGQCCPSASCPQKTCLTQDTWSEDTCTNCTCVDNAAVCTKQMCPEIKPGCTPEYIRGKCCPDMKCQGCHLGNGQRMRNGESWNKDKCTTCRCENGNAVCSTATCEQPKPGCKVVNLVNQCCPRIVCPTEGSGTSSSTLGTVGEQPCYAHKKMVPTINMMGVSIPITGFFNPVCTANGFYEGKQCHPSTGFCWCADPFGKEIANTRTQHGGLVCDQSMCLDHLNSPRIHGDQWKPESCTTCTCEYGQSACLPVECPVVPQGCVITSNTGCCPEFTCGEGCTVNEIHYAIGESWNAANCQKCTCMASGQQCLSRTCQVFTDPIPTECHAVWTDDVCCPRTVVCNGDCPVDKPQYACFVNPCDNIRCPMNPNAICKPNYCGGCNAVFYNSNNVPVQCTNCMSATGRMYLPGEDWIEGSCRLCACNSVGRSVCSNSCQQPQTASTKTCVDISGQVYYVGQKWENTKCQTCTCEASGQISCASKCKYSLTDPLPAGCNFIWTDDKCCPIQPVCNNGECPAGVPTTPCLINPCRFAQCPLNQAARCHSNYCGGCNAVFIDQNNFPVQCTECVSSWGKEFSSGETWIEDGCRECLCTSKQTKTCRTIQCPTNTDPIPDGCRLVPSTEGCCNLKVSCECEVTSGSNYCFACALATCPANPQAACKVNKCNGCNAVFYDEFDKPVHCQYLPPLHNCPAGLDHMQCFINPCANAQCAARPDALCRPNYCGTCHPEFFDTNGQLVNCDTQPECARACLTNPCETAQCPDHPTAICKPNYCGGCVAEFFDENNRQVTCSECPPSKPKHWCFFNPCNSETCSNYPNALCRPNSCGGCTAEFYNLNNEILQCSATPVGLQQDVMTTEIPVQETESPCNPLIVKYLTSPIETSFTPRCASDGYFSPKQCDGRGSCWCTDPSGQQVNSFINGEEQASNLECADTPCLQARIEAQNKINRGEQSVWMPDCDSESVFEEEQCNDVDCWCVESDGTKIPYSARPISVDISCDEICFGQLPSSNNVCTMNDSCDPGNFCHKLEGKQQGRCCKIPRNI
ncbi:uncharacterized protein [Antedon mediterranea]